MPGRQYRQTAARSCRPFLPSPAYSLSGSGGLDAVQTVGGVLAGEEHDIAIRRGLAGMHRIGGDVDHRAGLGLDLLVADLRPERALQNIDPLLVRVRMRFRAGTGGHTDQADDHAIAFDAGAVGGRIVGAAEDVVHLGEIEQVFTVARARGARCPGCFLRHRFLLRRTLYSPCVRRTPAPLSCFPPRPAAPWPARPEWMPGRRL